MADHLDVDKILPAPRTFTLAGELVDVSALPSRVVVGIIKERAKFEAQGDEAFDLLIDKMGEVCQRSNSTVTRDWLLENTTFQQLIAVIEFILKPLQEAGKTKATSRKAAGETKNA